MGRPVGWKEKPKILVLEEKNKWICTGMLGHPLNGLWKLRGLLFSSRSMCSFGLPRFSLQSRSSLLWQSLVTFLSLLNLRHLCSPSYCFQCFPNWRHLPVELQLLPEFFVKYRKGIGGFCQALHVELMFIEHPQLLWIVHENLKVLKLEQALNMFKMHKIYTEMGSKWTLN